MNVEIVIAERRGRLLAPDAKVRYIVTLGDEEIDVWSDPEHAAARWLVDHGRASRDDTLVTYRPDGVKSMTGSVGWFADRRVSETRTSGPAWGKWRPMTFLQGQASNDDQAE